MYAEIIRNIPDEILKQAINYPGFKEFLDIGKIQDNSIKSALIDRIN